MSNPDPDDLVAALTRIRAQIVADELRLTQHAHQEMVEEDFSLDAVLAALRRGRIVENYPNHKRGPCCLVYGADDSGRAVHIVCTTTISRLIIITVYEPKPPKWVSATQRRQTP